MKKKIKTLGPSKLKTIISLLGCLIFVYIGFSIIEEEDLMKWLGIVFFGFGALGFAIQLLPNSSYLKVHENRIEIRKFFKSNFIYKTEIEEFGIVEVPIIHIGYSFLNYHKKMVGFNLVKGSKSVTKLNKINKSIFNYQKTLPDNYGYKPEELAGLLNEWLN
ncbi:MAG: hypothetical protein ACPGUU_01975 [Flavobacteriaceae bacterium]